MKTETAIGWALVVVVAAIAATARRRPGVHVVTIPRDENLLIDWAPGRDGGMFFLKAEVTTQ